jgi:hypothetical protein
MKRLTVLTLSCLAVIIVCQVFVMAYAQSADENVDEIDQSVGYMFDLGDFATGCSGEMSDQKAVNECMAVIRAFNQHMEQLWSVHEGTIDKYRMKGNSGSGSDDYGGYYN